MKKTFVIAVIAFFVICFIAPMSVFAEERAEESFGKVTIFAGPEYMNFGDIKIDGESDIGIDSKMKFLWIMGICLALLAVFALWDSYKYPVCPKCHDNLRSRRIKGKIVCRIHGAVCILLFFCGAICGNAQEISDAKKFSENLPEYHALVKLAPDVNIYMVTAIDGCHIDILAKRLGIFPRVQDREYSGHAVAFPKNSPGLKQMAEDLAKGDGIITLDELFEVYPK